MRYYSVVAAFAAATAQEVAVDPDVLAALTNAGYHPQAQINAANIEAFGAEAINTVDTESTDLVARTNSILMLKNNIEPDNSICPVPEDSPPNPDCRWKSMEQAANEIHVGVDRAFESNSEFEEVFEDCSGNPLPAGKKWYKSKVALSGKDKDRTFYHAPTGVFTRTEASTYCSTGTPTGSMMWCPKSDEESTWIFTHHPAQPFDANQVNLFPGTWLGITLEGGESGTYMCDTDRYEHTGYFPWSSNFGGFPKNAPGNYVPHVMQADTSIDWYDVALTYAFGEPQIHTVCELNCDILSACEIADCANVVDPSSTCTEVFGQGSCDCSMINPHATWNFSEGKCETPCDKANCGASCTDNGDGTATCELGTVAFAQTNLYLRTLAPELVSEWLNQDGTLVDKVLEHGCHCGKLDKTNPFLSYLGGSTTLDELDEICRDWLRARNCNDNLFGGSCEADREAMRTGSYVQNINQLDYDSSSCGFTDAGCEMDSCQIDLKYMKLIREFLDDNPSFNSQVVSSPFSCTPLFKDKRERKCIGTAPDVEPKRMSDLEQLMTRANWNNGNPSDTMVYDEGRSVWKLNDPKEEIVINIEEQVVVFGWDNIYSITFETGEDFIPYSVGWVEKYDINNFGFHDTLGMDTKGGTRTIGMFSGTSILTHNDGDTKFPDVTSNFFNAGDQITLTQELGVFKFYVNGDLIHTENVGDWNNVFPAIDTSSRSTIRIKQVIYDDSAPNTTPAPNVDPVSATSCAVLWNTNESSIHETPCIATDGLVVNNLSSHSPCSNTDLTNNSLSRVYIKDGCTLSLFTDSFFSGQSLILTGDDDYVTPSVIGGSQFHNSVSSFTCSC